MYILHQQEKVPIRIQSKKSYLRPIFFDMFCLRRSLFTKNLACATFFLTKILSMGHFISVLSLVYRFISIENDSNSKTQQSQRHYLLKTSMKKVLSNKFFVRSNFVRYKSHNTNSIPKKFIKNNVRHHT